MHLEKVDVISKVHPISDNVAGTKDRHFVKITSKYEFGKIIEYDRLGIVRLSKK